VKGFAVYGAVLVLSVTLFSLAPSIDLFFSGLFYNPQHGFVLAAWRPLQLLEALIPWVTGGLVVLVLAGGLWLRLTRRPLWGLDRNALIFIVVAAALGPGLIVNVGLKDYWGRARPYQIEQFGGSKEFTPPLVPSNQCARNCSFVSGHASLAFFMVSFAFLLPAGRLRRVTLGAALAFGAVVGLGRIAAGNHFLSDVVDAALISIATSWLTHRWIVVHDGASPIIAWIKRLAETASGRRTLWVASILLIEAVAIVWLDRPVANYFHTHASALQPFFHAVQRFGLGYPYLVLSAVAFAVLRWGGRLEKLRGWDISMRAVAYIPAFFFAAVAVSGIVADILKVTVGRARPKFLFLDGTYDFTWFGWHADHWSFPSGHAATVAALMTALWCLWPRPLWLYVAAAALVAGARVVTGQHYLSDVIAGVVIGVLVTRALALWLLRPRPSVAAAQEANAAPDYRAV
jgi:lipid A 4'-phosphatase